jgi:hypothetical protein
MPSRLSAIAWAFAGVLLLGSGGCAPEMQCANTIVADLSAPVSCSVSLGSAGIGASREATRARTRQKIPHHSGAGPVLGALSLMALARGALTERLPRDPWAVARMVRREQLTKHLGPAVPTRAVCAVIRPDRGAA